MFLEMFLDKIIIDRVLIDFESTVTLNDREAFLANVVDSLYRKHKTKISWSKTLPVFFLDHVQSKMNSTIKNQP
jgi:hypothetical protein